MMCIAKTDLITCSFVNFQRALKELKGGHTRGALSLRLVPATSHKVPSCEPAIFAQKFGLCD